MAGSSCSAALSDAPPSTPAATLGAPVPRPTRGPSCGYGSSVARAVAPRLVDGHLVPAGRSRSARWSTRPSAWSWAGVSPWIAAASGAGAPSPAVVGGLSGSWSAYCSGMPAARARLLVGGARRGDVGVVGRGHRPGRREQDEPGHQVDPDQQADDDGERPVDGVVGRPGHQDAADDLEDLQPDRPEQRALEHPLDRGVQPREAREQVDEDGEVDEQGQRETDDAQTDRGRRCCSPAPPGRGTRSSRPTTTPVTATEASRVRPSPIEHADVDELLDHEVAGLDVVVPHRPDRLAQRVDPAQTGEQQADEPDETRSRPSRCRWW